MPHLCVEPFWFNKNLMEFFCYLKCKNSSFCFVEKRRRRRKKQIKPKLLNRSEIQTQTLAHTAGGSLTKWIIIISAWIWVNGAINLAIRIILIAKTHPSSSLCCLKQARNEIIAVEVWRWGDMEIYLWQRFFSWQVIGNASYTVKNSQF